MTPSVAGPNNIRFQRYAVVFILAAAYVHNAALSWGKWGDLLVDTGFDLQNARILMEPGSRLYVNPIYWYGPLAPEFNAVMFRLFGINSWVICCVGLICTALMTSILYRTARLFSGRVIATAAGVAFLYCCAFAHLAQPSIFNFVLGYSESANYGALLSSASAFFLMRHARKFRALDFWLAVLFLTLSAFTKVEILVAAALAHAAFLAGVIILKKLNWKLYGSGYASAIATVLGVYGYFYAGAGAALFHDNLFPFLSNVQYRRYAQTNMGMQDVGQSLTSILQSLGFHAAALAPAILIGCFAKFESFAKRAWSVGLALLSGLCAFLVYYLQSLGTAFLFLPVLCVAVLIVLIVQILKDKDTARRAAILPVAILWTFAFGMLLRMLLRTVSFHYGYYQLPASFLAMIVFYAAILPAWLPARPQIKIQCTAAILGLTAALTVRHFQTSSDIYGKKSLLIKSDRGQLALFPGEYVLINDRYYELPTGDYWKDVVNFLIELPRNANVLIVPYGDLNLTFFCGLNDPYKNYLPFFPIEQGRFDDDHFMAKVKELPPDYILYFRFPKVEAGQGYFGETYSIKTWAYLRPRYDLLKEYPTPRNGVALKYIQIFKLKATLK